MCVCTMEWETRKKVIAFEKKVKALTLFFMDDLKKMTIPMDNIEAIFFLDIRIQNRWMKWNGLISNKEWNDFFHVFFCLIDWLFTQWYQTRIGLDLNVRFFFSLVLLVLTHVIKLRIHLAQQQQQQQQQTNKKNENKHDEHARRVWETIVVIIQNKKKQQNKNDHRAVLHNVNLKWNDKKKIGNLSFEWIYLV